MVVFKINLCSPRLFHRIFAISFLYRCWVTLPTKAWICRKKLPGFFALTDLRPHGVMVLLPPR